MLKQSCTGVKRKIANLTAASSAVFIKSYSSKFPEKENAMREQTLLEFN